MIAWLHDMILCYPWQLLLLLDAMLVVGISCVGFGWLLHHYVGAVWILDIKEE